MTNIDDAIRQSLSAEDAKLLEAYGGEEPIHRQVLGALNGRFGLLNAGGSVFGLIAFIFAIWAGWRMVEATAIRDMLLWGGGAGLAFLMVAMIKLWFLMEMQKNAIIREVKRLELQIARASGGQ